ncbi:MAG: TonB family protein [Rhizomicrobium sp.]
MTRIAAFFAAAAAVLAAAQASDVTPSRAVGQTHSCAAFYPDASRRIWETGDVLIRYDVAADGKIGNISVVRPSGAERLDQAAVACVDNAWRNTPALQDGKPVASPGHEAIVRFSMAPPDTAEAYISRGYARANRGDLDGAVADFSAAIALAPKSAAGYSARAAAYDHLGKRVLARFDYDTAKTLSAATH